MTNTVLAVKTEFGVAVFAKDEFGNNHPAMLSSQPVISGTFRICQLQQWAHALEYAIRLIEENENVLKPTTESNQALNALSYLLGKLEGLTEDGIRQHKDVVEKMSIEKPDLLGDYLSAFANAVGEGEV